MSQVLKHILMSELTAALEAEGYDLGTGQYLQVRQLLAAVPEHTPPERYAALLGPLFARSPQEQQDFYRLFEQCLERARLLTAAAITPKSREQEARQARLWRNALLIITALFSMLGAYLLDWQVFQALRNPTVPLLLVSMLAAAWFVRRTVRTRRKRRFWLAIQLLAIAGGIGLKSVSKPAPPAPLPPEYREFVLQPGDTLVQQVRQISGDSLLLARLASGASVGTDSVFGDYSVSNTGRFVYAVRDTFDFFRDTVLVEAFHASGIVDSTFFVVVLQPGIEDIRPQIDTATAFLAIKSLPYPRSINALLPPPNRVWLINLYRRYAGWVKMLLMLLSGLGVWALLQWREKRRRLIALGTTTERFQPPYLWKLPVDVPADIQAGDKASLLLNLLRRRVRGEASSLDIPASIRATIAQTGRAQFRYKPSTTPPDYLLLIDRQSPNDHRALLFDWLCRRFRAQEAPLARFFYHGDARLCFDEAHPNGIALRELQHRFSNARLLLLGHGHRMLSPITGQSEPWTYLLTEWRRRVLMTPVPLRAWGRKEAHLSQVFTLLPASIQGWSAAIEALDALEPVPVDELIRRMDDVLLDPVRLENGDLIGSLRKHFPPALMDWIAACAVYPLLQWELTLYWGAILSPPGQNLLTFDNLLQLTRLPWFLTGRIPEAAREELVSYLNARGLEQTVRRHLQQLLEKALPPDTASVAFDEFRMNTLVNALALTKDRKQKQQLEAELASFQAAGYTLDAVALRYVSASSAQTNLVVPAQKWASSRLHQWMMKLTGGKPAIAEHLLAWPIWLVAMLAMWLYHPPFDPCGNKTALRYQGLDVCVGTPSEQLYYNGLLLKDYIQQSDTLRAEALLKESRELFARCLPEDTTAFLKNAAVFYFNKGVERYLERDIAGNLDAAEPWPPDLCYWFERAYDLEINAGGVVDAAMISAVDRCANFQQLPPAEFGPDEPPQFSWPVRISGRILEGDTQNGVSGARVTAGSFQATTDRGGYFSIEFPAAAAGATLLLSVGKKGFKTSQKAVPITPDAPQVLISLYRQEAQTVRPEIFRQGELLGLRDAKGNVLLPAEYNRIEWDAAGNGFKVEQRLRGSSVFGFADVKGRIVIPVRYLQLGLLREGLLRAQTEAGWGYLNPQGQVVIPFQFAQASDFNNGQAQVSNAAGVQFIINRNGTCIANCAAVQETPGTRPPTLLSFSGEVALYFEEQMPDAERRNYDDLYPRYYSSAYKEAIVAETQQNLAKGGNPLLRFVENELQGGRNEMARRWQELANILRSGLAPGEQIVVTITGYADANEPNAERLALWRAQSVEVWALQFDRGALQSFVKEGRVRILAEGGGSQGIRGKEPADWLRSARMRRATVAISVQTARK